MRTKEEDRIIQEETIAGLQAIIKALEENAVTIAKMNFEVQDPYMHIDLILMRSSAVSLEEEDSSPSNVTNIENGRKPK